MTIEQAYIQFLTLVNRNATNNKINVDMPRFVLLFNDVQNRYVEWVLEKRNEDDIRYVAPLLVLELPLTVSKKKNSHDTYTLPDNYFDLVNLHVEASKDCCEKVTLRTFEVKGEDLEELLADVNNQPSFEWEETFYLTTNKEVAVYKNGFNINSVSLSYYRYPVQVDIAGYINLNNASSTSINPEFDDKVVGRILIAMAKDFSAMNDDSNGYQINKDRLFTDV